METTTKKLELPTRFVVKRSSWLRGEGAAVSYLFRSSDQKMCCLGFLCEAMGVSKAAMVYRKMPMDIMNAHTYDIPEKIYGRPNEGDTLGIIVGANDSRTLTEAQREAGLTSAFKALKIDVVFED